MAIACRVPESRAAKVRVAAQARDPVPVRARVHVDRARAQAAIRVRVSHASLSARWIPINSPNAGHRVVATAIVVPAARVPARHLEPAAV